MWKETGDKKVLSWATKVFTKLEGATVPGLGFFFVYESLEQMQEHAKCNGGTINASFEQRIAKELSNSQNQPAIS